MTNRGPILAGLAALLFSTVSATAADLGGMKGGSIKDGYMPAMHEPSMARFYLRADYSHGWNSFGNLTEPPNYDLTQTSIGNSHSWGVGVGYYFSKNVRADATFDWRRDAAVRGSVTDVNATVQGERQFNVNNMVALANVYYDFDLRSHFTPYLGVGLGVARNTTSAGTVALSGCQTNTCSADFDGATQWNAAGALMAGFTARLHDRVHLDAGYRFLYLGNAHTGDIRITRAVVTPGAPTTSPDPIVHDLSAHEFRVGLRFDIK